ncbi:hypothetical protein PBY51_018416 [Eleginops maclovinus]|nr:hypothetical protein PBY51_018416 [Eleginops maclovinus]
MSLSAPTQRPSLFHCLHALVLQTLMCQHTFATSTRLISMNIPPPIVSPCSVLDAASVCELYVKPEPEIAEVIACCARQPPPPHPFPCPPGPLIVRHGTDRKETRV